MPRDMRGTGRYPPQPRFPPFAFYSAVRLGDPELLYKIMAVDPYFITQDNGAGAPLHFAVTYRHLDMVHHLLNNGAVVNQSDSRGWTPLHRAAHLAHLDGYMEIYEYLLSRGADPNLLTHDYDPYLNPGRKSVTDVAAEDERVRGRLGELNERYSSVPKAPVPHPDVGDWWTLYDYGLDEVSTWPADYVHPYPEDQKRRRDKEAAKQAKAAKRAAAAAALSALEAQGFKQPFTAAAATAAAAPVSSSAAGAAAFVAGQFESGPAAAQYAGSSTPSLPVAFLFPGQGSQAVGMISNDTAALPAVAQMLQKANEVLGYGVLALIKEGPKSKLDDTVYSQPALFVTNLVAFELLKSKQPDVAEGCRAMAGLSLGEYSALVAAGAMSFEEGLKVVKARGAAMSAAAQVLPGGRAHGMLSVVGLTDDQLERLCDEARQKIGGDTVCRIANYLFPQVRLLIQSYLVNLLISLDTGGFSIGQAIRSSSFLSAPVWLSQCVDPVQAFKLCICLSPRRACRDVLSLVMLTRWTSCQRLLLTWVPSRLRGWRLVELSIQHSWHQPGRHCSRCVVLLHHRC
eukprot:GHUV01027567.1.p1 GENE.GHUV01027567.1~~GHUV01027567.1.p1  ORF type:complete len:570 (+),score=127.17 GHUV01027567.1:335-2044(+)